jgi:hypothetical protein
MMKTSKIPCYYPHRTNCRLQTHGHRNQGLEVLSDTVLTMMGLCAEFSHVDMTEDHIIQFQLG